MNWIFQGGEGHRSISERRFSPFSSIFPGGSEHADKKAKKRLKLAQNNSCGGGGNIIVADF